MRVVTLSFGGPLLGRLGASPLGDETNGFIGDESWIYESPPADDNHLLLRELNGSARG